MKIQLSTSRTATDKLVKEGKLAKIEFYASTGDGFAEKFAKFLSDVGNYTAGGSSREIGIIDASDDDERALKIYIDGDGNDRIVDVKFDNKVMK